MGVSEQRPSVEAMRSRRETGYAEAMRVLCMSLHNKFCDPDHEAVGGWDQAVVEHVLADFMALSPGLYSCVLGTMALRRYDGSDAPELKGLTT